MTRNSIEEKLATEAIAKLKALQADNDTEVAHIRADDVLVALLSELGFDDVVSEYDKIEKWYA